MATKADRQRWEEQAAFMRAVGAVHAEWTWNGDANDQALVKLVLGPVVSITHRPAPAAPAPPKPKGPAAQALRFHETMFAATSMKPPPPQVDAPAAVPRPRPAKKAAKRGSTKNQKRGS